MNFYLPLLTMIIISCRIMVAIHSRSTMEFGRRISSTLQKQMKQEQTFTNSSLMRQGKKHRKHLSSEKINGQPTLVSIVVKPFDSTIEDSNIPSCPSDENTESSIQNNDHFWQFQSNNEKSFRFPHIKPIKILFPSVSSIKENDKRKSEDLSRQYSHNKIMKNSLSVSNSMKYSDRQLNRTNSNHLSRTLSTESSFSDDCQNTIYVNPVEKMTV